MDQLAVMLANQAAMQERSFGVNITKLEGEERVTFIKDMSLALLDEVHEALAEVGWKPWASSRHVNEEALQGELIDAWHFLMNLFLVAGMDAESIYDSYMKKQRVNKQRQATGYDGVEGKCPVCHRALDDEAVTCEEGVCRANV